MDQQDTIEIELDELVEKQEQLELQVEECKASVAEWKRRLAIESKKPENSKSEGQPVRAKFDEILFDNGIDRAAMFGGDIQGNDARILMGCGSTIVEEILQFVLDQPSRVDGISDERIIAVAERHSQLLHALDGLFSHLLTRRYEYSVDIGSKTRQYVEKVLQLERFLGMSVTPKSHILEAHACEQQARLGGIGCLDESFGERNHQSESLADRRYGCTRDFAKRERVKAKEEAQTNILEVQLKVEDLHKKRKARFKYNKATAKKRKTEMDAFERRQKQLEERDSVLQIEVPTNSKLQSLSEEVKTLLGTSTE